MSFSRSRVGPVNEAVTCFPDLEFSYTDHSRKHWPLRFLTVGEANDILSPVIKLLQGPLYHSNKSINSFYKEQARTLWTKNTDKRSCLGFLLDPLISCYFSFLRKCEQQPLCFVLFIGENEGVFIIREEQIVKKQTATDTAVEILCMMIACGPASFCMTLFCQCIIIPKQQ